MHLFLVLQDCTQGGKLESSSRFTDALRMSLHLLGENEEFVPTNTIFIFRFDLMLQWAKGRLVAVEGHGDSDVQMLIFVKGSTHCNTDSPDEDDYARKHRASWRSFVMEK